MSSAQSATPTASPVGPAALVPLANAKRLARRDLHRAVLDRRIDVRTLLREPPEALHGMTVADVMLLARVSRRAASARMAEVGARAVADRVNLFVPIERASARTRSWAAANAPAVSRKINRAQ